MGWTSTSTSLQGPCSPSSGLLFARRNANGHCGQGALSVACAYAITAPTQTLRRSSEVLAVYGRADSPALSLPEHSTPQAARSARQSQVLTWPVRRKPWGRRPELDYQGRTAASAGAISLECCRRAEARRARRRIGLGRDKTILKAPEPRAMGRCPGASRAPCRTSDARCPRLRAGSELKPRAGSQYALKIRCRSNASFCESSAESNSRPRRISPIGQPQTCAVPGEGGVSEKVDRVCAAHWRRCGAGGRSLSSDSNRCRPACVRTSDQSNQLVSLSWQ